MSSPLRSRASRRFAVSFLALTLGAGASALLSGCLGLGKKGAENTPAPPPAAAKGPEPPDIDYAKVRPNELGRIPVLMYHEIGDKPYPKDPALVRTADAFKKDLELLYAAGFRPVNMGDVLNDNIDVPAGKSPVVITFDDARESQFRLIETDSALKLDPKSAVGILTDFNKKHPDWGMKATFFVLPKSPRTMAVFGQDGLGDQKLNYLVDKGFELGNHTTLHKSFRNMPVAEIQKEIGFAHNEILRSVPKAKVEVLAVPMGIFPKDRANLKYLLKGTYEGKTYEYKAAMLAAYRPVPSPASKAFDPFKLERIAPVDNDPNGVRNWIVKLTAAGGDRYVSDGDPNVVSFAKGRESELATARLKEQGKLAHAYSPFGSGGGAKPIITDADEKPSGGTVTAEEKSSAPKPITP